MTDPARDAEPPAWKPLCFEAGGWLITSLFDAAFRLDGGAMWGVVPRNLWARMTPPAEDNTIALAARPFLAERDGVRVVVEGGMGARWNEKQRGIYHLDRPASTTLEATLARLDVGVEDVDHVIASHCHFDHIGALVEERDGGLVPLFPRVEPAARISRASSANAPHVAGSISKEKCGAAVVAVPPAGTLAIRA